MSVFICDVVMMTHLITFNEYGQYVQLDLPTTVYPGCGTCSYMFDLLERDETRGTYQSLGRGTMYTNTSYLALAGNKDCQYFIWVSGSTGLFTININGGGRCTRTFLLKVRDTFDLMWCLFSDFRMIPLSSSPQRFLEKVKVKNANYRCKVSSGILVSRYGRCDIVLRFAAPRDTHADMYLYVSRNATVIGTCEVNGLSLVPGTVKAGLCVRGIPVSLNVTVLNKLLNVVNITLALSGVRRFWDINEVSVHIILPKSKSKTCIDYTRVFFIEPTYGMVAGPVDDEVKIHVNDSYRIIWESLNSIRFVALWNETFHCRYPLGIYTVPTDFSQCQTFGLWHNTTHYGLETDQGRLGDVIIASISGNGSDNRVTKVRLQAHWEEGSLHVGRHRRAAGGPVIEVTESGGLKRNITDSVNQTELFHNISTFSTSIAHGAPSTSPVWNSTISIPVTQNLGQQFRTTSEESDSYRSSQLDQPQRSVRGDLQTLHEKASRTRGLANVTTRPPVVTWSNGARNLTTVQPQTTRSLNAITLPSQLVRETNTTVRAHNTTASINSGVMIGRNFTTVKPQVYNRTTTLRPNATTLSSHPVREPNTTASVHNTMVTTNSSVMIGRVLTTNITVDTRNSSMLTAPPTFVGRGDITVHTGDVSVKNSMGATEKLTVPLNSSVPYATVTRNSSGIGDVNRVHTVNVTTNPNSWASNSTRTINTWTVVRGLNSSMTAIIDPDQNASNIITLKSNGSDASTTGTEGASVVTMSTNGSMITSGLKILKDVFSEVRGAAGELRDLISHFVGNFTGTGVNSSDVVVASGDLATTMIVLLDQVQTDLSDAPSSIAQPGSAKNRTTWLLTMDLMLDTKTNKMALVLGVILFALVLIGLHAFAWIRAACGRHFRDWDQEGLLLDGGTEDHINKTWYK
ncbi:hypothetical protein [Phascolarctid gammaherpesvirus 1]|uniref:Uncharacterized protein n=1 Tax=Phascolarctid gammaherpesvirus 1 TaxID=2249313 RepID=A0A3Q8J614_9GAMA|nr:hypothetical protein KM711_gp47 [Phascolarctid gammaherpesvirus 1]AZB49223.1 hypothetical protein [Phascolarctid gammaherpesvirus 1]